MCVRFSFENHDGNPDTLTYDRVRRKLLAPNFGRSVSVVVLLVGVAPRAVELLVAEDFDLLGSELFDAVSKRLFVLGEFAVADHSNDGFVLQNADVHEATDSPLVHTDDRLHASFDFRRLLPGLFRQVVDFVGTNRLHSKEMKIWCKIAVD